MDLYLHVRVLFSIILGLGISHLLRGVAKIVQHPGKYRVYWVQLVWVLFLFLYMIHFWWWEFRLHQITEWTFPLYFFVAVYSVLLYLLCTLLFPEEMGEYESYEDYFYARKGWIFSLLTILFMADMGDTLVKGSVYFRSLGFFYYIRTLLCLGLSIAAIKVKDRRFHAGFAIFATAYEVVLIVKSYLTVQ